MKNISSKIYSSRNKAGTTIYTNEITQTMNRFFLDLKDPIKAKYGGVVLMEPEKCNGKWDMGIKIPGALCGQIRVEEMGQGSFASIWKIQEIKLDGEICFVQKHFNPQLFFTIQKYQNCELILPIDFTKARVLEE